MSATQPSNCVEAALGDPDAAGVAVVDEHRRRAGVGMEVRREAADVPAVAHRPERQERDERVLGGVEGREEQRHRLEPFELVRLGARTRPPRCRTSSAAGRAGQSRASSRPRPLSSGSRRPVRSPRRGRRRARGRVGARRAAAPRSPSSSPSSPACTSRRRTARRPRASRSRSSSRTRYCSAEVEVDGALVDGGVRALALREAEHVAGRGVDDDERVRATPSGAAMRAAGRLLPGPDPAARRLPQLGDRAARGRAPPGRASPRRVSSIGASKAAAATCPSSTRGLAWSRIAASTCRSSSACGSRMKYWSSASSRRDEHREAVPAPAGASPLLAEARDRAGEADRDRRVEQSPMSIPSSSASVDVTPSSSPSTRRRSISRRCCGV